MFRGVTTVSLDSKGRLVVPARYRDALVTLAEGRVVVTADASQCLLLYPEPEWGPVEKRLMELPAFNSRIRQLQRLMVGHAEVLDLDANGRILLTPSLRQFAALEKSVVLVGQGSKFELWNDARWNALVEEALSFKDGEMPPELEGFTL
ncbi:MAG: division/cell wall cluster transcriptional repressor MraZ [Thiobacillaceae bacterium]